MITCLIAFAGMLEQARAPITFMGGEYVNANFKNAVDPVSNVVLYADSGCDGSFVQVYLTKDFDSVLRSEGYEDDGKSEYWSERKHFEYSGLERKSVSPTTNRGIHLGMSVKQVAKILGKPSYVVQGKIVPGTQYIYRWTKPKDGENSFPRDCKNYYVFRKGRLEYIEFNSSSIGGG